MKNLFSRVVTTGIACGLFLTSMQAKALISGQFLVGKRTLSYTDDDKTTKMTGNEVNLGAHVDPIPLVPIAFGASLTMDTYTPPDETLMSKYNVTMFSPEVVGWVPIPGVDLKPYARLGYTLYGLAAGSGDEYSASYTVTGTKIGIGIAYNPLPLIDFLLEYQIGNHNFKPKTVTAKDQDVADASSLTVKSSAILVGVQAGI